jgi:hypothetical protein
VEQFQDVPQQEMVDYQNNFEDPFENENLGNTTNHNNKVNPSNMIMDNFDFVHAEEIDTNNDTGKAEQNNILDFNNINKMNLNFKDL